MYGRFVYRVSAIIPTTPTLVNVRLILLASGAAEKAAVLDWPLSTT